jgi:SHS2 domain-containing protein
MKKKSQLMPFAAEILYNQSMMEKAKPDGFYEVSHRADLALDVRASGMSELFIQSAMGLYSLLGIQKSKQRIDPRRFSLRGTDYESLLVCFLNEILHIAQDQQSVFESFHLVVDSFQLTGDGSGFRIYSIAYEIKAATFHDLEILKVRNGFHTRIVFDL